mgnify:CR=1 FL=1
MADSFVGVQEPKDGNPAKMTVLIETKEYIERVEFKLVNNIWVQSNRKKAIN